MSQEARALFDLPPQARQGLEDFSRNLQEALGDNLAAVILYGSAALGDHIPGREGSFEELWRSELLDALRDRDRLKGRCGACRLRWLCGGCRVIAHALAGDPLAEHPQCFREESRLVKLAQFFVPPATRDQGGRVDAERLIRSREATYYAAGLGEVEGSPRIRTN